MIETLQNIDQQVFLFLNSLHSPAFDPVMSALSGKLIWVPMYLAIAAAIIWRFGWRRGLCIIAACALAVACSDLVSSKLIRPLCCRLRPANLDNPICGLVHIVNGYRGGAYGFPSCHACNTFALAVSTSLWLRWRPYACFILFWALLQCYTRIYLGVHYPGDLIVGAAIGSLFGYLSYRAFRPAIARMGRPKQ